MFYPYITWGDGLQIAYSEVKRDGTVLVRFELPDERIGFKFLECELPTYRVVTNKGYQMHFKAKNSMCSRYGYDFLFFFYNFFQ